MIYQCLESAHAGPYRLVLIAAYEQSLNERPAFWSVLRSKKKILLRHRDLVRISALGVTDGLFSEMMFSKRAQFADETSARHRFKQAVTLARSKRDRWRSDWERR